MTRGIPVTCPFCALHCGDVVLSSGAGGDPGVEPAVEPACARALAGYRAALREPDAGAVRSSAALKRSCREVASALRTARQPLVLISGSAEQEAARAALRLARKTGAIVAPAEEGSALSLAVKSAGMASATLGELCQPGGVILVGADPSAAMPRFWEWIGRDGAGDIIRVDSPDLIGAVRSLRLAQKEPNTDIPGALAGAAGRIRMADGGVVLFGIEGAADPQFLTEILLWLGELNAAGTWYALPLCPAPDFLGVGSLLLAECGSPGGARFRAGEPDFSYRIPPAGELLRRGDADFVFVIGAPPDGLARALGELSVRSALVSPTPPSWEGAAWLPVAQPGVDAGGTMLRLDGVPVVVPAAYRLERPGRPAAAALLGQIEREVGE